MSLPTVIENVPLSPGNVASLSQPTAQAKHKRPEADAEQVSLDQVTTRLWPR